MIGRVRLCVCLCWSTPFFYKNSFYKNIQAENRLNFKKGLRIIVRLILYFPGETFILGCFHGKITLLAVN